MEWAKIVVEILAAVGAFVVKAIQDGNVDAALEVPLSSILPHELRTTIAKRVADEAATKKFSTGPG